MRILLISHGFPPDSVGGVEQHVEGLATALSDLGHDVHVYAKSGAAGSGQGTHAETRRDARGFAVTRVVYRYENLDGLHSLYEVPVLDDALRGWLAARPAFDVAHVHHLTGMSTGLLAVLREVGVPSVLTLHDYWLMCPRGQMWRGDGQVCADVDPARCSECLRPTFGGWVPPGAEGARIVEGLHDSARATLSAADVLVVPSARAVPPFVGLGVAESRIRVVENGVDTGALEAVPPLESVHDRDGPLRVGFLGTLIPSKGLQVLVDAVMRLPRRTVRLDIFGNAVPYHGDTSYLTRVFSRLDPRRARVVYHGPYTTGELPSILGRIDVLAAPALWEEAFGLTVREALAAGRPVVASRIGGLQDALRDGQDGLYVPPGDVDALADAVASLAGDRGRLLALAGEASRREQDRKRGFRAMAGDLVGVYERLAADRT